MRIRIGTLLIAVLAVGVRAVDGQDADPAKIDETIRGAKAEGSFEQLDRAAASFRRMKEYALALRLERAALEIREAASGRKSGSYAQGLVNIGDLEAAQGHYSLAAAQYKSALDGGDRAEAFGALMGLGLEELRAKKYSRARDYFERGARVAEVADRRTRSLLFVALTDGLNKRKPETVEERYKAALAAAAEGSGERAAAQWCYARFLEEQKRHEEAQAILAEREAALKGMAAKQPARAKARGQAVWPIPMYHPEPAYSEEARLCRYVGRVLLSIEVGTDGHVVKESVIQPLGLGLDEQAMDAVSQWRFQPGTLDGKAAQAYAEVEVNFRLR